MFLKRIPFSSEVYGGSEAFLPSGHSLRAGSMQEPPPYRCKARTKFDGELVRRYAVGRVHGATTGVHHRKITKQFVKDLQMQCGMRGPAALFRLPYFTERNLAYDSAHTTKVCWENHLAPLLCGTRKKPKPPRAAYEPTADAAAIPAAARAAASAQDESMYTVASISEMRFDAERGQVMVLVQWVGYTNEYDTWEPYADLVASHRLLHSYWTKSPMDLAHVNVVADDAVTLQALTEQYNVQMQKIDEMMVPQEMHEARDAACRALPGSILPDNASAFFSGFWHFNIADWIHFCERWGALLLANTLPAPQMGVVLSMLQVFTRLNARSVSRREAAELRLFVIEELVKFERVAPLTEACILFHALIHIAEQISRLGPNDGLWMLPFERCARVQVFQLAPTYFVQF